MFLAITGYKGSGKDTFTQALLGNNNTSWLIYGTKPWLSLDGIPKVACSLAQPIKNLVHSHINIPYSEENKRLIVPSGGTVPYAKQVKSSDGMTIRQLYIEVAEEAKKDNPYIWVDKLMASNYQNPCSIVTDVRFPCELERLQCPSIRIYRSEVSPKNNNITATSVPDRILEDDITETSLDHHRCDYFAVTSKVEAALFITEFPQYTGYTLVYNIGDVPASE